MVRQEGEKLTKSKIAQRYEAAVSQIYTRASNGHVDGSVRVTQVAIEGIDGPSYFMSFGDDGSGLTIAPNGAVFYVIGPTLDDYIPVSADANTVVMVEGILTTKTFTEDTSTPN